MLLILTVGLVVAGIVLLVIGFVDNSLAYIYATIACAGVAVVALVSFSRLSRRRAVRLAGAVGPALGEPAFAGGEGGSGRAGGEALPAVTAGSAQRWGAVGTEEWAQDRRPAPEADDSDELEGWDEEWDDEPVFPIEDYDDLRVPEILPLLGELEPDELLDVRQREQATKARGTVLRRIDAALSGLGATPPGTAAPGRRAATGVPAEPIAGYASMRAAEILPLLSALGPAELEAVAATERSGASRTTILTRIARLQGTSTADAAAPPAPPGPPPPARPSPPLGPQGTAKGAPARRGASKAAGGGKAAAGKVGAKKGAVAKAPARRAQERKAPAAGRAGGASPPAAEPARTAPPPERDAALGAVPDPGAPGGPRREDP